MTQPTQRDSVCPLQMSQQQFDNIKQCEAVVVREYERADGSRFANAVAWGDADEMRDQAETPRIFIVPEGLSVVGHRVVLVSELLGAKS